MNRCKNSVEQIALPAQISGSSAGNGAATKSGLLAELLSKPETYNRIDSGWRLVMWLMLTMNGAVVESYDLMAQQLGNISAASVKNWALHLEREGILEREQKGKRVSLKLVGDYMKIAAAADEIHTGELMRPESHAMVSMNKIAEGAGELGGHITITISGVEFKVGKS
jgi:hypothetical protein